jgi:hypothetical protein
LDVTIDLSRAASNSSKVYIDARNAICED